MSHSAGSAKRDRGGSNCAECHTKPRVSGESLCRGCLKASVERVFSKGPRCRS